MTTLDRQRCFGTAGQYAELTLHEFVRHAPEVPSMPPRRSDDATPPDTGESLEFLKRIYSSDPDPWRYASSWYERRKYQVTLSALPRERYERVYEPGCSIGEFTKLLAPRCGQLVAVDCIPPAVIRARRAVVGFDHVRVEVGQLPGDSPNGPFDLIVASELLYYFGEHDLDRILDTMVNLLRPGGELTVVNWLNPEGRAIYDGYNVRHRVDERIGLARLVRHDDECFLLDVYRK